jgi:hypothetical protein
MVLGDKKNSIDCLGVFRKKSWGLLDALKFWRNWKFSRLFLHYKKVKNCHRKEPSPALHTWPGLGVNHSMFPGLFLFFSIILNFPANTECFKILQNALKYFKILQDLLKNSLEL